MAKSLEIPKREKQNLDEVLSSLEGTAIASEQDYQQTAQMVAEMNARIKQAEKQLDPLRKKAYEEYQDVQKGIKAAVAPYKTVVDITKKKMADWYSENERKRLEEQRRLQEEARKKAEEQQLADAEYNKNEDILEEPAVAPQVKVEAPKVEGVSFREKWSFEITDPAAIPREYLMIDEVKIRKVVGALKHDAAIPGVRIFSEKVTVLRS